jgi:hypothetical protein
MDKQQLTKQQNADGSITYSYTYLPTSEKSFMEQEEEIAEMAAAFGRAVTEQLLGQYDTKGEPLLVQGQRMTRKDSQKKLASRPTARSK